MLVYIMVACLMFATSLPSFTGQLDRHTYDILPKYTKVKDFVKEHTSSSIPGFFTHNKKQLTKWNFVTLQSLINCTTYKNVIRFHLVVGLLFLVKILVWHLLVWSYSSPGKFLRLSWTLNSVVVPVICMCVCFFYVHANWPYKWLIKTDQIIFV